MKTGLKSIWCVCVLSACFAGSALGLTLSGNVNVAQSATTAAAAKINATNTARRQILYNVLSQYADRGALGDLIQKTSDDDLMNLVSSVGVSNEQISSTSYTANISMNIDNDAARKWLSANNIQNWVPGTEYTETFGAYIVLSNGLADWAELKRIARSENIDMQTSAMSGNQIMVKIPLNYRSRFTASIKGMGWKYTDNDGVLQVWK